MTTLSKTLLTIAVGGLTIGSIVAYYGENASTAALAVVLPLGAVASGLFLIVFMLQKEVAVYDQEQTMKSQMQYRRGVEKEKNPLETDGRSTQGKNAMKIKPSKLPGNVVREIQDKTANPFLRARS